MKIGEENQAFAEVDILRLDGLLDLDHHVGFAPDIAGVADNLRAGVLVLRVKETGLRAGLGLDQNRVAGFGERFDACRSDADAGFVVLDLFGNADDHVSLLSSFRMLGSMLAGKPATQKAGTQSKGLILLRPDLADIVKSFVRADPPEIEIALLRMAIDLFQFCCGEIEFLERVERVVKLLHIARADEGRSDTLVTQHPGDGHLREGLAARLQCR